MKIEFTVVGNKLLSNFGTALKTTTFDTASDAALASILLQKLSDALQGQITKIDCGEV